ncbi:MAG TPA: hypothetical protein VHL57_03765 [Flavobacteriales bacterium]|jgi:hypothetical protein|nr:hypothetical protein [Flavobacteriales bacterium]
MNRIALAAAPFVLGTSLALGFMLTPATHAHAATITEDDSAWNCATMGNRICGPGTPLPGCFDENRQLVALWPCHVVVNPDGSSDVWA